MRKHWLWLILLATAPAWAQDVAGRVLEDSTGDPLASVELKFHKAGIRELAADLETERDGRFHADGIAAGEYTVEVSKPNHTSATLTVHVPASGILVRLVRFGVIAGTVKDSEGAPLAARMSTNGGRTNGGARIAVLVRQNGTEALKAVRTLTLQDDGTYRVFDLAPGQYAIGLWWYGLTVGSGAQLYPDAAHPRFFDVAGGEQYRNVDFAVSAGASFSIAGKVEGAAPKARYSVTLGNPELPAMPVGQLWTEDDGSFRLQKVSPGTYDLLVAGPVRGYGAYDSILDDKPVYGRMRIQVIGQDVDGVTVPLSGGRSLDLELKQTAGCPESVSVRAMLLEPWGLSNQNAASVAVGKPSAMQGLAPARYALAVESAGSCFLANGPVADLTGDRPGPATIALAPGGSIRGTLRNIPAGSRDYVVLLLEPNDVANAPAALATVDEHGRFAFGPLRPGRYLVAAKPAGDTARARWVQDLAHMMTIDVPGGSVTEIDLPVSKEGEK